MINFLIIILWINKSKEIDFYRTGILSVYLNKMSISCIHSCIYSCINICMCFGNIKKTKLISILNFLFFVPVVTIQGVSEESAKFRGYARFKQRMLYQHRSYSKTLRSYSLLKQNIRNEWTPGQRTGEWDCLVENGMYGIVMYNVKSSWTICKVPGFPPLIILSWWMSVPNTNSQHQYLSILWTFLCN